MTALLTNDVTITAQYARRLEGGIVIRPSPPPAGRDNGSCGRSWRARPARPERTHHLLQRMRDGRRWVFYTPYLACRADREAAHRRPSAHLPFRQQFRLRRHHPYFRTRPQYGPHLLAHVDDGKGPDSDDINFTRASATGMYSGRAWGIWNRPRATTARSTAQCAQRGAHQGDFEINSDWTWGWDGTIVSDRSFLADYDLDDRNMLASYVQATGLSDRNYTRRRLSAGGQQVRRADGHAGHSAFMTGDYDQAVMGGELSFRDEAPIR